MMGNTRICGDQSVRLRERPRPTGLSLPAHLVSMAVKLFSLGQADWVPWAMVELIWWRRFGVAPRWHIDRRRGRSPWLGACLYTVHRLFCCDSDGLERALAFALALSGWLAFEEGSLLLSVYCLRCPG